MSRNAEKRKLPQNIRTRKEQRGEASDYFAWEMEHSPKLKKTAAQYTQRVQNKQTGTKIFSAMHATPTS
jgi:hypothetical protein